METENDLKIDTMFLRGCTLRKDIDAYFRRGLYAELGYEATINSENKNEYTISWYDEYGNSTYIVEFTRKEFLDYIIEKIEEANVIDAYEYVDIKGFFQVFISKKIIKSVLI